MKKTLIIIVALAIVLIANWTVGKIYNPMGVTSLSVTQGYLIIGDTDGLGEATSTVSFDITNSDLEVTGTVSSTDIFAGSDQNFSVSSAGLASSTSLRVGTSEGFTVNSSGHSTTTEFGVSDGSSGIYINISGSTTTITAF